MSWHKDKSRKNGVVPFQQRPQHSKEETVEKPVGTVIEPTEPERLLLEEAQQEIINAKINLSDIQLQILALEQQRSAMVSAIANGEMRARDKISMVMKTHGVDPNNPAKSGRWHFDWNSMRFTRLSPPAESAQPPAPPSESAPPTPQTAS
jgi:hypothetical protein